MKTKTLKQASIYTHCNYGRDLLDENWGSDIAIKALEMKEKKNILAVVELL